MTVSVVLRLVEQALASGRLTGEAEMVETGERRVVRDADDLVAFLRHPRSRPHVDTTAEEYDRG